MSEALYTEFPLELQLRFLEATQVQATTLIERHMERRKEWQVDTILPPALIGKVALRREQDPDFFQLHPDFLEGIGVFYLTETAIVYYERDVSRIFNPNGQPPDDNNPHDVFSRRWPREEFPHSYAGHAATQLFGMDLQALEMDRRQFIDSGNVPVPTSTFHGVAYTGPQEGNTKTPYQNVVNYLKPLKLKAQDDLEIQALDAAIELYRRQRDDESYHENYIVGVTEAGLQSGDKNIVSAILIAMAETYRNFQMPGGHGGIPRFAKRSVPIRRIGLFSPKDSAKNFHTLLTKHLDIRPIGDLTGEGAKAQDKLGVFINGIEEKYPEFAQAA